VGARKWSLKAKSLLRDYYFLRFATAGFAPPQRTGHICNECFDLSEVMTDMETKLIASLLSLLSQISSLLAAFFWFWASRTKIPNFPSVGLDSGSWVFKRIHKALKTSSCLNAVAALCSGVAAFSYFLSQL
jgi:hypothetical protein